MCFPVKAADSEFYSCINYCHHLCACSLINMIIILHVKLHCIWQHLSLTCIHLPTAVFSPLSPHPAPPPPGGVTAMATSDSSITVTWTPPTLPDNRPPVTGYTVTAVPSSGSTPELLPATATSTVLGGLQRGTVYTIKVVAHSVVGDSLSENYTINFLGKYASS